MLASSYKHIIFDLDGTIFDTYYANLEALADMMEARHPKLNFKREQYDPYFGIPGRMCLQKLGVAQEEIEVSMQEWVGNLEKYVSTVKPFPTMLSVLSFLKNEGFTLGIITSRMRNSAFKGTLGDCLPDIIAPYFTYVISASDVKRPKPYPDSMLRYMELTGAKPSEILFVGDATTDLECAHNAGVDFGLALWGAKIPYHVRCKHYFLNPFDVVQAVLKKRDDPQDRLFRWADEIQALGQIGVTYSKNIFDTERYERMREIAKEMLIFATGQSDLTVRESFLFDKGYITPKIDTRAAIFNEQGEILLVKERLSGLWNMPGGWCDENETLISNTVKEVREEAGLLVNVKKLIAIIDRNHHNSPRLPYGALKSFMLCTKEEVLPKFLPTDETLERAWFSLEKIPRDKLRVDTNTYDQIVMCFNAHANCDTWQAVIE